jgi:hypothetical protein
MQRFSPAQRSPQVACRACVHTSEAIVRWLIQSPDVAGDGWYFLKPCDNPGELRRCRPLFLPFLLRHVSSRASAAVLSGRIMIPAAAIATAAAVAAAAAGSASRSITSQRLHYSGLRYSNSITASRSSRRCRRCRRYRLSPISATAAAATTTG